MERCRGLLRDTINPPFVAQGAKVASVSSDDPFPSLRIPFRSPMSILPPYPIAFSPFKNTPSFASFSLHYPSPRRSSLSLPCLYTPVSRVFLFSFYVSRRSFMMIHHLVLAMTQCGGEEAAHLHTLEYFLRVFVSRFTLHGMDPSSPPVSPKPRMRHSSAGCCIQSERPPESGGGVEGPSCCFRQLRGSGLGSWTC